jgi:hypothetical protein
MQPPHAFAADDGKDVDWLTSDGVSGYNSMIDDGDPDATENIFFFRGVDIEVTTVSTLALILGIALVIAKG